MSNCHSLIPISKCHSLIPLSTCHSLIYMHPRVNYDIYSIKLQLFTINTITVFLMHPLNTVKNKIQLDAYYMQSLSDGFTCMCPEGFEGTSCHMETNRDHCFPFPCENGGNCTVSASTQKYSTVANIVTYTDGF